MLVTIDNECRAQGGGGGVKWVKFTQARSYWGPGLIRHIHFFVATIITFYFHFYALNITITFT